jgi:hypothetical protein
MYPAPIAVDAGKFIEASNAPIITIPPGFTPPMVDPGGNFTTLPTAVISASPTYKEPPAE